MINNYVVDVVVVVVYAVLPDKTDQSTLLPDPGLTTSFSSSSSSSFSSFSSSEDSSTDTLEEEAKDQPQRWIS